MQEKAVDTVAGLIHRELKTYSPPYDTASAVAVLGGKAQPLRGYEAEELGYGPFFEAKAIGPDPESVFRIIYAGWKPEPVIRFAIAAELGFLLFSALRPDGSFDSRAMQRSRLSDETSIANEFAAAFLMPKGQFIEYCKDNAVKNNGRISVQEIAGIFGVTEPAILVRGSRLGVW